MRLHLLALGFALVASGSASAFAEDSVGHSKSLEMIPGQAVARPSKMRALFSPQAQLFVEQKEAPTASKTSLRFENNPKLSQKSKD